MFKDFALLSDGIIYFVRIRYTIPSGKSMQTELWMLLNTVIVSRHTSMYFLRRRTDRKIKTKQNTHKNTPYALIPVFL